jgi:hypothetical protein
LGHGASLKESRPSGERFYWPLGQARSPLKLCEHEPAQLTHPGTTLTSGPSRARSSPLLRTQAFDRSHRPIIWLFTQPPLWDETHNAGQ